jgi:uncharacterized RDD family membrane protein YckC
MGDIYSLDTPEHVSVDYDVAGVGSRFLAALIDALVLAAVLAALVIVTVLAAQILRGTIAYAATAIGVLIINAVFLGYFVFFEIIWNGQSPGKRAMGLRVVKTSGYPITPVTALIRNVVRLVDWLPAFYAVGVITMIANRHARRLGDLVAGTMVIKEKRYTSLSSLSSAHSTPALSRPSDVQRADGLPLPEPAPLAGSGAQLDRLTREDEALIRDFLNRRHALSPRRRDDLARRIATVVHRHIGGDFPLHGEPGQPAERYLEWVLAARDVHGSRWGS